MPSVAIVDYRLGNLFSVRNACIAAGLDAIVSSDPRDLLSADAVILPGVGAFGDAMKTLDELDLVQPLRDIGASGKPLIGICLGMQLLMSVSHEFGTHEGIGLIDGTVERLESGHGIDPALKIPHVGWESIRCTRQWEDTPLRGLEDGSFMYFVHSFYVRPQRTDIVLSVSHFGPMEFCSTLMSGNIFATQYHPERSGREGLKIYSNIAHFIERCPASV